MDHGVVRGTVTKNFPLWAPSLVPDRSWAVRTRQNIRPHLGRSAAIHYHIVSIVSLSIHLPFPLINSTICSFIYLPSWPVNHPCRPSPSMHERTTSWSPPHPRPPRPGLSLEFKSPSRREAPKSLGALFYLLDISKSLKNCRREPDLLHPQVLDCRYHSHPHSTCLLLHPRQHLQLAALPAVPFSPRQQRLAEITEPAACPDSPLPGANYGTTLDKSQHMLQKALCISA